jgi:hypothetical protein
LYTWYLTEVNSDYAASVAHLADISGKANPYYVPNYEYAQEIVKHPAFLIYPDVLLIHILCKTHNIHLNVFSFVPAEVSIVLSKLAAVVGFCLFYLTVVCLLFAIVVSLLYIVTTSFEDENEVDNSVSNSQVLAECEKEISNLDDMFIPTLLFLFIYG